MSNLAEDIQALLSKHAEEIKNAPLYPSDDLFPGDDVFPSSGSKNQAKLLRRIDKYNAGEYELVVGRFTDRVGAFVAHKSDGKRNYTRGPKQLVVIYALPDTDLAKKWDAKGSSKGSSKGSL